MALEVGPTRVRLPDPMLLDPEDPASLQRHLQDLNAAIALALQQRPAVSAPRNELLLFSPQGDVYTLGVDNAGTLSATLKKPVPA